MPFMRVGTYPTGNYATLGPSQLQPPFTGDSIHRITRSLFTYRHRAGLRPNTSFFKFAKSCVFSKQSPPSIRIKSSYQHTQIVQQFKYPLSLSYKAILPSSFNILTSMHLSTLKLTYQCRFSVRFSYSKIISLTPVFCRISLTLKPPPTFNRKCQLTKNRFTISKTIQKHTKF